MTDEALANIINARFDDLARRMEQELAEIKKDIQTYRCNEIMELRQEMSAHIVADKNFKRGVWAALAFVAGLITAISELPQKLFK